MEKVEVDRYLVSSYEQEDMGKLMESLQKYIEVSEENLELRKTLPYWFFSGKGIHQTNVGFEICPSCFAQ